ncbi:M48 family metallopeptidase [Allopusillimonas ginsengisoli]|nr:M48 family metallopeptidase [Allopusillimonas ginsengisoli]
MGSTERTAAVTHTFCHSNRHDHSPDFWGEVESVMLDYQQCRVWLRENGGGC